MALRTRMAPSPTGEFHIGSMRTLLYNYVLAKKEGGKFVLRIEDTDRERFVEGATERLIQVIRDYGLSWDEGPDVGGPYAPYVQSERREIYGKYAEELIAKGHAYPCFCTKERLEALREEQKSKGFPSTKYDKHCLSLSKEEIDEKLASGVPNVVRLKVPSNEEVSFEDKILGKISFPTGDIDDQVLLKSDGFPTYHLGVVVDDYLMKINFVMRGVEWLPSTPKHILLYTAFGWEVPVYAHLPLLKEKGSTTKLSKRMGSVAAVDFLVDGYLPEALLNCLMFLGWNPGTEKEIYSLDEFINDFSVDKLHKTDLVVFDREKLLWYNGQYIRKLAPSELLVRIEAWAKKQGVPLVCEGKPHEQNIKVVELVQDRLTKLNEFNGLTGYFYTAPKVEKAALNEFTQTADRCVEILSAFETLFTGVAPAEWHKENLDSNAHRLLEDKGYKPKEAFMTVRLAVTGQKATPPLFDVLEVLGKDETLMRLRASI